MYGYAAWNAAFMSLNDAVSDVAANTTMVTGAGVVVVVAATVVVDAATVVGAAVVGAGAEATVVVVAPELAAWPLAACPLRGAHQWRR